MHKIINEIWEKESNILQIKFIKLLLSTFQYQQNLNNINFNIVQNIKNLENPSQKNIKEKIKNILNIILFFNI